MNEMANKFSLAGDKFIPEMHLKQLRFTDSTCGSFTKKIERIQKLKETGDSRFIKINYRKLAFKMKWLIKIYLKEYLKSQIWWLSKRSNFNDLQFF